MSPDDASRPRRVGFWLYAFHLFTVFGIALSNALLAISILASPVLVRWRSAPVCRRLRRATPLLVLLGLYSLLVVLSIAFSDEPAISSKGFSELFNATTLVLGLALIHGERDVRRITDGLVIVGGVVAVAGLATVLGDFGDLDHRIRGPFSHYMTFAGFLMICDLLLISSLLSRERRRQLWRWGVLVAINAALLGSLTRSAWVGAALAVTLLILVRAPKLLVAYVPVAVLIVLVAPVPVLQRIGSIPDLSDRSNYDRLCMAQAGLAMIAEHPVLGLGPEMVEERYPLYRPPSAPRYQVPHLHNSFLEIAAERGIPSLLAYLGMVGLALAAGWRRYRREGGRDGPRADLLLGLLVALVAFNLAGLFENNWGDTEVQRPVWFLIAAPFCLGSRAPEEVRGT